MRNRTHVFVGPTLEERKIREILPDACVHPPIREGAITDHVLDGDKIGIIDGLYYRVPAVRHKEILTAINRGVLVMGSSSMGALRAAELYPFGMHGVGTVFGLFRSGVIDGDDEVAVVHASADEGWFQMTLPLVSIRVCLVGAVRDGLCTREAADAAVGLIKQLAFFDRSVTGVRQCLERAGIPPGPRHSILNLVRADDIKRSDAVELLHRLASTSPEPVRPQRHCSRPCQRDCGEVETHFQAVARWAATQHEEISRLQLMTGAQLILPEYPAIYRSIALSVVGGGQPPGTAPGTGSVQGGDELAERALSAAVARGFLPSTWPEQTAASPAARAFLTPAERQAWTEAGARRDLALTALVRSCRVPPGVPPVWLAYDALTAVQRDHVRRVTKEALALNQSRRQESASHAPHRVTRAAAERVICLLWGHQPDTVLVRDRGFVGLEPALRAAQVFAAYVFDRAPVPR